MNFVLSRFRVNKLSNHAFILYMTNSTSFIVAQFSPDVIISESSAKQYILTLFNYVNSIDIIPLMYASNNRRISTVAYGRLNSILRGYRIESL